MKREEAEALADAIIMVMVAKFNMDNARTRMPRYAYEKEEENYKLQREALINKLMRKVQGALP